jgi:hypothetical protein
MNNLKSMLPSDESQIIDWIGSFLDKGGLDTLNSEVQKWSDNDSDSVMNSGGCYTWNNCLHKSLKDHGIYSKLYEGTPKDPELPDHWIVVCGDNRLDFTADQFWAYGLGDGFDDVKLVYTEQEYKDIWDSYSWSSVF